MKLSIVIVNFHNPPLLRLSLTSLRRALPADLSHEVVVIDSEATPETGSIAVHDCARLFDRLIYIPFASNIGYTRGVNEGIARASGSHVLILNPDIVIVPGALEKLIHFLNKHLDVGLVGPQLLNFDGTRQDSCFAFYTPLMMLARRLPRFGTTALLNEFLLRNSDFSAPTDVDWLMGSALMTTRAMIDRVGSMDEQFFLYLSEVDWAHRFWENGLRVAYLPDAQMYHYHQRESKGRLGIFDIFVRKQTRWHLMDALRYFRKHGTTGNRPTIATRQLRTLSL